MVQEFSIVQSTVVDH